MQPRDAVRAALTAGPGEAKLVAFVTAGFPEPSGFANVLAAIGPCCDAIEIGVPFSDPMADGVTIQRASEQAIARGVSLRWIFDELEKMARAHRPPPLPTTLPPILLMSYLNPLLAFGYERLAERAVEAGVSGFMVPDLPFEECGPLREALGPHGLALVQFVTPATAGERLREICRGSDGFVYAVTRTGITGRGSGLPAELAQYLDAVKSASDLPVCAGFGVRSPEHVALIAAHADGVIVGSALVEALERGADPAAFLISLRAG